MCWSQVEARSRSAEITRVVDHRVNICAGSRFQQLPGASAIPKTLTSEEPTREVGAIGARTQIVKKQESLRTLDTLFCG